MAFDKLKDEMDDGGPGGPYREIFAGCAGGANLVRLALLMPSRAQRMHNVIFRTTGSGAHRCFVLNPASSSPAHLRQFEFLGILMGCTRRTRVLMPWNSHSWSGNISSAIPDMDLCEIDGDSTEEFLRNIENCNTPHEFDIFVHETLGHERPVAMNQNSNAHEISAEESKPTGLPWKCKRSDGIEIDLRNFGPPIPSPFSPTLQEEVVKDSSASLILEYSLSGVSFAQRHEFVRRYESAGFPSQTHNCRLCKGLQRMFHPSCCDYSLQKSSSDMCGAQ